MAAIKISKKTLKKIKRFVLILVILLIVLIVLLIRSSLHSEERVFRKLIEGMNNLNYTYNDDNSNSKVQVFGKRAKITNAYGIETYVDYEGKTSTIFNPEADTKQEQSNNGIEEMQYYELTIKPYFNDDRYKYKYVGKDSYNSQECTIIEFKRPVEEDGRKLIVRLWINSSLCVVEKMEMYIECDGKEYSTRTEEYNFHTNANRLTDVELKK